MKSKILRRFVSLFILISLAWSRAVFGTNNDCTQYDKSRTVGSGVATIQYVSTNTTISMLFRTSKKAWVSIGRSQRGKMIGSDAVVGLPSSNVVKKYLLNGETVSSLSTNTNQNLINTEVKQNSSGTFMTFTQNLTDGRFPLSPSGTGTFIWAIGAGNAFTVIHDYDGSFSLTLSPCIPTTSSLDETTSTTGGNSTSSGNSTAPSGGGNNTTTPGGNTSDSDSTAGESYDDDSSEASNDSTTSTSGSDSNTNGDDSGSNDGDSSEDEDVGTTTNSAVTSSNNECSNSFTISNGLAMIVYESTNTTISMTFNTSNQAWISLGRSQRGRMVGADAVIGLPALGSISTYNLNGYSSSDVVVTSIQGLVGTEITQSSGGTVMKFTQNLKDGRFPLEPSGSSAFIWAIGYDNSFPSMHKYKGSFTVTLGPCGTNGTPSNLGVGKSLAPERFKRFVIIHGILAVLAWGLLAPAAIAASAFRSALSHLNNDKTGHPHKVQPWFLLHRYLNTAVYIVTVILFFIIVSAVNKNGKTHFEVNKAYGAAKNHALFGLIFFVVVTIQVLLGIFRPSIHHKVVISTADNDEAFESALADTTDSTPPKTLLRTIWEHVHRGVGVFLIIGSIYQIISGLALYAKLFASSWYSDSVLWVYVVTLLAMLAIIRVAWKRS